MATTKHKPSAPRLLVRPSPLKGESLRGYLLRVGERNGCGRGANLFSELSGNKNAHYLVSEHALENIAQSLDLSRGQVEAISYRPIAKDVRGQCLFFGHVVSVNHLRSRQPAVCPDCLREQQAISGLWDLRAVCACPHHSNWLIDQCPACGESLKWSRGRVAICQCGFDLRTAKTKPAPSDVLILTALIYELVLNDLPTFAERSLGYPEAVRQIPLNELLALFRYTADVLVPGYPLARQVCGDGSEAFSKHSQAAGLMAGLLKFWPNELLLILAGFSSCDGKGTKIPTTLSAKDFNARYLRVLGNAFKLRSVCLKVPDFFKQTLHQFRDEHCISASGEGCYLNPSMVRRSSEGERVLKLGVCFEALGFRLKDGRRDEVATFSAFLQKKAELLDSYLPPRKAMWWLGCSSAHFRALIDLGLLRPKIGGDFLKADLANLVVSFDLAAVDSEQAGRRWGDLLRLTSFKSTRPPEFAKLVWAIAKKKIGLYKIEQRSARDLSDLYVAISELRKTGHWIWPDHFTTEPR